MKTEDAIKMIELCLEIITDQRQLEHIQDIVINKRISLSIPKTRKYNRRETP